MTEVPGTRLACTNPGTEKSPLRNAAAILSMWARICATPWGSSDRRTRLMRPPSERDSNRWLEVYWSTPIATCPRACTPEKALSDADVEEREMEAIELSREHAATRLISSMVVSGAWMRAFILRCRSVPTPAQLRPDAGA